MSEIEKMKKYIANTPSVGNRYCAGTKELLSLMKNLDEFEAIALAFEYGQAKGYRAAKAEVRK